ncbi:Gfo/Idh/MocA family protein [Desmospora activa]|uniref:Putative dehydrogenase n=1 Tax=Desmospora activa DSM 45169 TaxID=1121389 RepID=A0A2T4Z7V4_9BACL|nr:Gfo/Idh/MocA family oxidoreductase [Desmospora activa]PTM57961.1 putative dehydrogenase [Desmospora activa DSM 45169]
MKPVSFLLVGIGGYGNLYLKTLFEQSLHAHIRGVVDIDPTRSEHYPQLIQHRIPIYSSMEAFYQQKSADLAILSTPIHLHAQQICEALSHGSHVLCEKPLSSTQPDAKRIIETRNRTGKFVAIGFNWSFTSSIQTLKKDVMAGLFGKAKRLKTVVLWPRTQDYFQRTSWAGKKVSGDGTPIWDSVANNATSHFLHNMLYVLGAEQDRSAEVTTVTAELYRANDIETFDTCAVKLKTDEETEVLFFASHAVREEMGPRFLFEFEKAVITYNKGEDIVAHFDDGSKKVYPDPEGDHLAKLRVCLQAVKAGSDQILCGPEASFPHVQSIHAMQQSVPEVASFSERLLREDSRLIWVEGLADALLDCFERGCLPSEAGLAWSQKGEEVSVES